VKGRFENFLFNLSRWVKNTPERAIDTAYKAAITIKKLEDDYFEGNPVSKDWGYADNTYSLFQTQLQNALSSIDVRLAEYKISAKIPSFLKSDVTKVPIKLIGNPNLENTAPNIIQKLAFIDLILSRYRATETTDINPVHHPVQLLDTAKIKPTKAPKKSPKLNLGTDVNQQDFTPKYVEQTLVPISILQSLERIKRNLTAGDRYEQDLVQEVRQTRRRINIGIRFIIILVVVTITTQQLSKNFIYGPIISAWEQNHRIEFSRNIQREALDKYRFEKEKLEFQLLIGSTTINQPDINKIDNPQDNDEPLYKSEISNENNKPNIKPEVLTEVEMQKLLEEKAKEIYSFSEELSLEGVKNFFADVTAGLVVFAILVAGKKEIGIIKQFLDETLHGLNDNGKAFIIIVITDTFVGYHSSHGWEVLIDTFSAHFGLPENRDLTLAFIAIVPVFLDGLIKFWVFQALTQSSPSTSAIYSEMNK
jgi:hypothetical protein